MAKRPPKTSMVLAQKKQTHRSMEQNRELTLTCSINLQQRRQEQTIEKTVSLINCVGKIGPLHAKNQTGLLFHNI